MKIMKLRLTKLVVQTLVSHLETRTNTDTTSVLRHTALHEKTFVLFVTTELSLSLGHNL